ncbi:MarR-type HTH domain protein [Acididesulfobacillus acetoxydans]|uniref:Helix_turn_helix multiple antibiotic resistance protein n=1 Tax=Acididesulfobacillus acetoxydans TaxID=1561005 RepID=A0A8S0VVY5_9FIRM|nr:MarR family transcriptional regulator [Acididesulfobacillus acetoxydans]CAA7600223.1 MarR-type HTH domain protein [Acididesulfobacillus acetoxydans]CEJ09601.1 helix_turn_helix multiple antibiotic resistance protein [Acididesulfobacillus acetoxydans]
MSEDGVTEQFLSCWRAINRHLRKGMLTEGEERITRLQWMLLRQVNKEEANTMGNLAAKFGVRPSTISQMADRLEKSQLIRRVPDTRDARIKSITLTEKGQGFIERVESLWAIRLQEGLGRFSPDEQNALLELLERLVASLAG